MSLESTYPPRILVLEADRTLQARCRRALGLWGFDVRCTASAERALELLAKGPCAALVVNLDTPSVDALGMLGAIRSHGPTRTLPVLALSGSSDDAMGELVRGRGCDRILEGPFDADGLAAEVESVLARATRAAA